MPFVKREPDGRVSGVFAVAQPGYAEEEVKPTDPDLRAYYDFLKQAGAPGGDDGETT